MKQLIIRAIKTLLWLLGTFVPSLAAALAFRLFCHPAGRSQIRANERTTMVEAQTEDLIVRGHRVRVYSWGSGERPVLLVHGWESRGARFARLAKKLLALGYSPITFDSPGHGDSEDDKTTILDYLAICQALNQRYGGFEAIVAHSFGVLCAFYALKQSVQARCVVAISGVSDFRYLIDTFSTQLGLVARVKAGLQRRIECLFAPLDDIWNRFSVTHGTGDLQQPVLVIHDRQDEAVDLGQAQLTAEHFGARAQLVVTDGLGHNRILRDTAVLDAVCEFIERVHRSAMEVNVAAAQVAD